MAFCQFEDVYFVSPLSGPSSGTLEWVGWLSQMYATGATLWLTSAGPYLPGRVLCNTGRRALAETSLIQLS